MDQSWVVAAGRFSLYVYYLLILALLVGIVLQHAFPKRGTRAMCLPGTVQAPEAGTNGRRPVELPSAPRANHRTNLLRFLVEYVGNLDVQTQGATEADRRRNHQARILMEHIKEDLARRNIPPSEKEHLVEKLRESIQSVEPEQAG
jgi:hypothetical protein